VSELVTYDSAAAHSPSLTELVELFRYRELLSLLVVTIIKTRYKRSTLGALWTLLNPLLNMVVMTIAFSSIFRFSITRYPVYVLSGLIFWNFFAQTTTYAMSAIVWGGSLIKRVYVPRTVFAVATVGNGLVNLGLSLVPLALIMLALKQPVTLAVLFVPVAVLLVAMFSLGVALLMSALAVLFVDVVDMYQIIVQASFFLTPVMYPQEILPAKFIWYLSFNPLYLLLELFRSPLYLGVLPSFETIVGGTLCAVGSLLLGWWFFSREADELAYRI